MENTIPRAILILISLTLFSAGALADPASDAKRWYQEKFAPLWATSTTADPKVIKFRTFFVEGYRNHPKDTGSTIQANTVEEWAQRIEGYKSQGWRGGRLLKIDVWSINERTVYIRTHWMNTNADKSQFKTCDYYLASLYPEGWKFTNYFLVQCPREWIESAE